MGGWNTDEDESQRVGPYELLERIGRGGMAEVMLARAGDGPLVAIKRVHPHLADDPDYSCLFEREALISSWMNHPNITRVFDHGAHDGRRYLVMEYIEGKSLAQLLRDSHGGLSLPAALTIVRDLAAAMHYVHELRDVYNQPLELIHRDLKPSNLLIRNDGTVKLLDFGIAKSARPVMSTLAGGELKGSYGYMAPEQFLGGALDRRSDVFGLGVILYELTLNRRAFNRSDGLARREMVRPRVANRLFPAQLEAIILRATATHRSERYATAEQLVDAIERFARSHQVELGIEYVALDLFRADPLFKTAIRRPPVTPSPTRPRPWPRMNGGRMRDAAIGIGGAAIASLATLFGMTAPSLPSRPSMNAALAGLTPIALTRPESAIDTVAPPVPGLEPAWLRPTAIRARPVSDGEDEVEILDDEPTHEAVLWPREIREPRPPRNPNGATQTPRGPDSATRAPRNPNRATQTPRRAAQTPRSKRATQTPRNPKRAARTIRAREFRVARRCRSLSRSKRCTS